MPEHSDAHGSKMTWLFRSSWELFFWSKEEKQVCRLLFLLLFLRSQMKSNEGFARASMLEHPVTTIKSGPN